MANSAESVSAAEYPSQIMSWSDFTKSEGLGDAPDHWTSKIGDWFTGAYGRAKNRYDAYLTNMNNLNEAKAVQSARAWDYYMDSTKYRRAFQDLESAGINPYLLLNNGNVPGAGSVSSPKASYSKAGTRDAESNNKGRDFALILLAIARLAATLA